MTNDVTSVQASKVEKPVVYCGEDGKITVNGVQGAQVTLSDLSGRVVESLDATGETVVLSGEKGSIYLVKVAFGKVTFISKVIVK